MSPIQLFSAQPWVEHLGWTLIHFLWQGAAIAALYAIVRRSLGQSCNAQARYLLASVALTAMVAAPLVTFTIVGGSDSIPPNPFVGAVPASSTAAEPAHISTPPLVAFAEHAWQQDVLPWFVMAWFAGALVFWLRLTGGWIVAARMRSILVRPAPLSWQRTLDELRSRIRISRPVRLLTSALVQVPTVVGWLRPVVLVPIGALAGLPAEQVQALLAHELAHIRRHDYLVNILQSLAESLLFYHPAVWWISNHLRDERELCCDDVAVAISGDAFTYAQALADLESHRPAHFTPALAANGGSLRQRIGRLLGQPTRLAPALPGPGALAVAILIAITAFGMFGQPTARPTFEAVSIKPNDLGGGHAHTDTSPGRFNAQVTARVLIQQAFGIKDFQVSGGPGWLGNDNYDIVATVGTPIDMNSRTMQPYLQSLLTDRFHLKYHRETKEFPVYLLVPAKNGPKLTPHSGTRGEGTNSEGKGANVNMTGTSLSMAAFASYLSSEMDRPVIDNTAIQGRFDVKLNWSSGEINDSTGPSMFTALQDQLGLKLESGKGPVEILVVDSVDKPSEN